jgi:hypothetical protein
MAGMTPNSHQVEKDQLIFGLRTIEGRFPPFIPLNFRLMIRPGRVGKGDSFSINEKENGTKDNKGAFRHHVENRQKKWREFNDLLRNLST